jgi:cyclopropane-fatty-acyl-phospholipid synthase
MWYIRALHTGRIPDCLIRTVLRFRLSQTLRRRYRASIEERTAEKQALIQKLRRSPIAIHTNDPNEQHYEVPSAFFELVLGKRLKYSCCYWPAGLTTLDEAEEAMLRLTCDRAQIEDGLEILDLGCGWGSLSLWIGQQFPSSHIVAVSNSHTQRNYIERRCRELDLHNIEVITADVVGFEAGRKFDRVLSVEMFEHMKNYEQLLARIASWLKPGGLLFVHIFSHREFAYEFDARDPQDWMAQTFFTGGTMPSDDLLLHFKRDLTVVTHWCLDDGNYARTLRAWLANLDARQLEVREIMSTVYGRDNETRWLVNWRLFFLVCSEVWNLRLGHEYLVSHYLFQKGRE